MVDCLTTEQRHRVMSRIRSKDTKPEMLVRRLLYAEGYRYRLHAPDLPGTPDLVFRGRHRVVFVNGCFWHSHSCSNGTHNPATNADFWAAKRTRTVERDSQALAGLAASGWAAMTVWECELRDLTAVADSLHRFLGPPAGAIK
ncbi:very short patch repair endonuclease [Arthrobacter glacialis]|uniref:very short patch repair endonuclease n=1 Tax=Arthrobacter glacialis TaxID=1664 RepID=UPI000CD3F15A|nr:very short patch repair endonuclease [Arthrobacter glacialis]POH60979.1 very short patch repair endonuclease [Arthrobacter glacialis]